MEVAAFHPPAFAGLRTRTAGRGLVSVALFVTSPCQGVTLHPALRSPDFPLCREIAATQRLPGRLPGAILRSGSEVALVLVEGRVLFRVPARIAEDRHGKERLR